jgi:hypothetical protein
MKLNIQFVVRLAFLAIASCGAFNQGLFARGGGSDLRPSGSLLEWLDQKENHQADRWCKITCFRDDGSTDECEADCLEGATAKCSCDEEKNAWCECDV